jgi:hypothetical protein
MSQRKWKIIAAFVKACVRRDKDWRRRLGDLGVKAKAK